MTNLIKSAPESKPPAEKPAGPKPLPQHEWLLQLKGSNRLFMVKAALMLVRNTGDLIFQNGTNAHPQCVCAYSRNLWHSCVRSDFKDENMKEVVIVKEEIAA